MRAALAVLGMLAVTGPALAAAETFECGGALVEISAVRTGELHVEDIRLAIRVSRGSETREISYEGGIDYIGGHCVAEAGTMPRILFQAYCGGSGCKDLDNWGIIDPQSLQVLLAPSDTNRMDAQRILGAAPVAPKRMLSVKL